MNLILKFICAPLLWDPALYSRCTLTTYKQPLLKPALETHPWQRKASWDWSWLKRSDMYSGNNQEHCLNHSPLTARSLTKQLFHLFECAPNLGAILGGGKPINFSMAQLFSDVFFSSPHIIFKPVTAESTVCLPTLLCGFVFRGIFGTEHPVASVSRAEIWPTLHPHRHLDIYMDTDTHRCIYA